MTGFVIDAATTADVTRLGPNLRASDVEEVRAASGLGAIEALGRSFGHSTHVWVVRDIDGQPLALWGVGPLSLVEGRGCPWLLAAEAFDALGRDIARLSRPLLAGMRALYPRLENHVDARHAKSVRWLKWLGFTIEPASPWGVENRPFHRFWI
ncbi:MAG: hypothetical protein K9G48_08965 [Reyranella sp.]|nr:hypothetical protein [Reyranella sp.]